MEKKKVVFNLASSSRLYKKATPRPPWSSPFRQQCSTPNLTALRQFPVASHKSVPGARLNFAFENIAQKGQIGISVVTYWYLAKSQTAASMRAASRSLDFVFGWFAHPVTFGDYPQTMRSSVGNRLPKFSKEETKLLRGSLDFLGVNYYTSSYADASSSLSTSTVNQSFFGDMDTSLSTEKNGVPLGAATALSWLYIYPKGIRELMLYIKEKYNDPEIYITENGFGEANNSSQPLKDALKDSTRIRYHSLHLSYLLKSIKEGVKVKGYFAWSFLDVYEWDSGYTVRFGLTYVDYKNNLKRYLKYSAYWLKMFLLK